MECDEERIGMESCGRGCILGKIFDRKGSFSYTSFDGRDFVNKGVIVSFI